MGRLVFWFLDQFFFSVSSYLLTFSPQKLDGESRPFKIPYLYLTMLNDTKKIILIFRGHQVCEKLYTLKFLKCSNQNSFFKKLFYKRQIRPRDYVVRVQNWLIGWKDQFAFEHKDRIFYKVAISTPVIWRFFPQKQITINMVTF